MQPRYINHETHDDRVLGFPDADIDCHNAVQLTMSLHLPKRLKSKYQENCGLYMPMQYDAEDLLDAAPQQCAAELISIIGQYKKS
jgi:hypothetical protein